MRAAPLIRFALGLSTALSFACSSGSGTSLGPPDGSDDPNGKMAGMGPDPGSDPDPDPTAPTFHEDIEPIFQANCQVCHHPGGIGPFSVLDYDTARAWSARIAEEVSARRMPPWLAEETDECRPRFRFADDVRLAQEEIDAIVTWANGGAPRGDPSKAPPPREIASLSITDPDVVLTPDNEWVVSGDSDQFRCFVLDPGFTSDTYIDAMHFTPGNPRVVHHAIAFLDPSDQSAALVGEDGGYPCFGGPGFSDTQLMFAWAPGATRVEYSQQVAYRVPSGSKVVLQIHYHPLGDPQPDLSTLELRIREARPDYLTQILPIGNFDQPFGNGDGLLPGEGDRSDTPEFRIPAGATEHVERMRLTLPETLGGFPMPDFRVLGVGNHMHYVGVDMKWEIEHPEPKAGEPERECMLHTPRWDFGWQRGYAYDVAIEDAPEYRPGDRLHIECTYDNSMGNPFVREALEEQNLEAPRDVFLGDETLDEMCLALLGVAYLNPF